MPVAIESACTAACKVELAKCIQGSIARLSLSALSGILSTCYTAGMAEASDLVVFGTDSSLSSELETVIMTSLDLSFKYQ